MSFGGLDRNQCNYQAFQANVIIFNNNKVS